MHLSTYSQFGLQTNSDTYSQEEGSDVAVSLPAEHNVRDGVPNQPEHAHQSEHTDVQHEREETAIVLMVPKHRLAPVPSCDQLGER